MKISRNSFASSIRGALACIRCAHVYVQCMCLNRDSAKRMEKERKDLFSKFKNINVSDLFLTRIRTVINISRDNSQIQFSNLHTRFFSSE